jgi:CCR4-NOT complex subunit CAF16
MYSWILQEWVFISLWTWSSFSEMIDGKGRADIQGVVYLGTEWASNPVVRSDIVVSHFLDSVGGYRHKARRDKLLALLDVDLDWWVILHLAFMIICPSTMSLSEQGADIRHMHQISDGERRRVQLCMGLMTEWDVLLLDEVRYTLLEVLRRYWYQVTVDLDVLVRSDLIDFLVQESETRGATIVCKSPLLPFLYSVSRPT